MKKLLKKQRIALDSEQLDGLIDCLDLDQNGTIDYKEFVDFAYASSTNFKSLVSIRSKICDSMDEDVNLEKVFKKYDSRNCSFVKIADFKSAVSKLNSDVKRARLTISSRDSIRMMTR